MDNDTRKLLNLTDENLIFGNDWLETEKKEGRTVNIITGRLTSTYRFCKHCGSCRCVKNGTYTTTTKLPDLNGQTTYLKLKRERYICKECHSTFSAETSLVDKSCCISKPLKYQIAIDLQENRARKAIATSHGVSDNTVQRVLMTFANNCKETYKYLPRVICVDEFKSTKSCTAGMSFICADAETKEIITILNTRRLQSIKDYFTKYSLKARQSVEFLVMDMNASYGELLKSVFPNAELIVDRFHIVQHINRSLNQLRVKEMNKLKQYDSVQGKQYRRLKRYWKLLLKDYNELDYDNYSYNYLFKRELTESEIVDELLSYSPTIRVAYNYVQNLKFAYNTKDSAFFLELAANPPKELPKGFNDKFKIFKKFKQGIINALKHPYSNGFLEGINNKIKNIKRVAYGYRSFFNFRARIYLIQGKTFKVS